MDLKYGMLAADGHFFIPGPKHAPKEVKEQAAVRAKPRTEFLVLTQSMRPALVTVGVLLMAGAALLLKF